ncbi:UNVERIFIED_ORG: maltose alpha-D-glucosyltransferase/alpha-amylase [Rhizobium esperanzae]
MINDLWYKNAVIYCLSVETFMDANGDGVGDFQGLMRRLDYLSGLGVTAIWLMPFQESPGRDDGYDVSDYYNVDRRYGTLGDFVEFTHGAKQRGIRVLIDLVINHTSKDHPWFQDARSDPHSRYREWYVWSDKKPANADHGMVFPGVQKTTWTHDEKAEAYYFHRFYDHQPDLNTSNPEVQAEILKIMGFWIQLGVSGFRMDAAPFIIATKGAEVTKPVEQFDMLRKFREFLQWRLGDSIVLAEANILPKDNFEYFGDDGDRMQMMFNFQVNQALFYAFASADTRPLKKAMEATKPRPATAQWGLFLRNHDELDLGRLTDKQRGAVFAEFGPDKNMQLYDRGIRRRLAPMLGGDRRRIEMAYSLLFSLPGTPVIRYGDEIGMGDDLNLPERDCARTPMQWSTEPEGGFTKSPKPITPVIKDGPYGFVAYQCRRTAARSELAVELDRADDPNAQGSSGDRLGRFLRGRHRRRRRAGASLRLARQFRLDPAQSACAAGGSDLRSRYRRRRATADRYCRWRKQQRRRERPSHRPARCLRLSLVSCRRPRLSPQAQGNLGFWLARLIETRRFAGKHRAR